MPFRLDTPGVHTTITRTSHQEVTTCVALGIQAVLINLEDSFLHDFRTIVVAHEELLVSGVHETGIGNNRGCNEGVLRVVADELSSFVIRLRQRTTCVPTVGVVFVIHIRIEVDTREKQLCSRLAYTIRRYTLSRKLHLQILQLIHQPFIEFMAWLVVRILIGLGGNKRSIEEEIHEVEIVESTNPTHLCQTIFILIRLLRAIRQIVVAILDIEVQTGINTFDHTTRTGPVGSRKATGLIIIPDPESLIGCQVITIPDGTIEAGHTCIHIFDIGVFTRSRLTNDGHTGITLGEHTIRIEGCRRVRINRLGIQVLHARNHTERYTNQCDVFY